jgi:sensor histidine kinase YesM
MVFSVSSFAEYIRLQISGQPVQPSFSLLYIGYISENFLFSLGLGKRQKLILDERNQAQSELIAQIRQNEMLEREFRSKLESEIKQLKATVEKDAMERISVQFEKNIAELKLAALRNQMNPHFIFNSLNSIKGYIIDNDREQAVFYLNKFSKLIRMILSSSIEKDVSLAEEIEIAELYLQVENIRFNNEIHFDINVAPELALNTIKVPALILQPFLENAIWHGLSSKKGSKELFMDITLEDDQVKVSIYDNGIGRKQAAAIKERKVLKRKSYGIALSEERLSNFVHGTSKEYTIKIIDCTDEEGNSTGTRVLITLPVSTTQIPPS